MPPKRGGGGEKGQWGFWKSVVDVLAHFVHLDTTFVILLNTLLSTIPLSCRCYYPLITSTAPGKKGAPRQSN